MCDKVVCCIGPPPANGAFVERRDPVVHLHSYGGRFHKVLQGWTIPKLGTLQVWVLWLLGNAERRISPLCLLRGSDLAHLDALRAQARGVNPRKCRVLVKGFSDLKFLMEWMVARVKEKGTWVDRPTEAEVMAMYRSISDFLVVRGDGRRRNEETRRDGQMKWNTTAKNLRSKIRRERRRQPVQERPVQREVRAV